MAQPKFVPIVITADDKNAQAVVRGLTNAFTQLDERAEHSGGGMRNAFLQADLGARVISAGMREASAAVQEYLRFGSELANLNTLLDDPSWVNKYRDGLLNLDPYLGNTSELARGMYQAISSGVDSADALNVIEASAKAARAGLASTFETVDAGTSVMASFGLKGKDLASIYDKMFEVVKRGKVEMPQLASSIGLVSSFASQAGVSLDEMLAAVATGSRTNRPAEVIEGMRTALANIVKPSADAQQVAHELGIDFDAAALKSKGLAKFLDEVSTAAGGDTEKLVKLFGDVRAMTFIMSVTGNQSKQFAADLRGVAAASGTVEEAFQKQKESLAAQAEAAKVMFQQGLMKGLILVEPLLTGVMSLVTKYPAVFAAAATVVTGLVIAHMAYNSQLALGALTALPNFVKGIKDVVFWMVHFQTAMTDSQTAATALTGWLGLAAAAIGLIVYAVMTYETATDRANKITLDQVKAQGDALAQSQELARETAALAASQSNSTEAHERLNVVIGKLDPATQAYVNSLDDEKNKVDALKRSIDDLVNRDKGALEATLRTTGAALLQNADYIHGYEVALTNAQERINRWEAAVRAGTVSAGEAKNQIAILSQYVLDYRTVLDGLNKTQSENTSKLFESAQALGLNHDQFVAFFTVAGYGRADIAKLVGVYDQLINSTKNHTDAQQKDSDGLTQGASAADQATEALKRLKNAQDDISKNRQLVSAATIDIVKNAANAAEARRQAQELLKNDPAFAQRVSDAKRFEGNTKAVESYLFPDEHKQRGAGSKLSSSDREDNDIVNAVSRSLRAPRPSDPALAALISQAATRYNIPEGLAFAQLHTESRFNTSAKSPAGAIGLGQIMPATGARYGFTKEDLLDPKKNLTAWGKYMTFLVGRYGDWDLAVLAYHQGEGTVDKLVKLMTNTQGGRSDVQRAARGAGVIGPAGRAYLRDIRRYDYEGKGGGAGQDFPSIVLGGQYQKDTITGRDDLTKPQVGGELIQLTPAKLDGFLTRLAAIFEQIRNRPLDAGPSVVGTTQVTEYENSPTQQALVDYNKEVGKREEEAAGRRIFLAQYTEGRLREIRADFYNRETEMSTDLAAKEETLAQLRRQATDDQLSDQRRLLAAKNEEVDLTQRLIAAQDEYANAFVNDPLRKQITDLEELTAAKRAAADATDKLADATVVKSEQVRATVLQHLAENSSATDAWANGLVDSFDRKGRIKAGKVLKFKRRGPTPAPHVESERLAA